ncbi:TRAP transporter small permease subunit [Mesorhizobium sp. J428]|uniref:TRAP transporter small permease subunit n=1 Tax=Mesorhizobium sp. J428 TaxID=2898440 RepID=UPI002150B0ED|nr:TRAP transporter small permease [Mesorhizobium sp. J428]MCR5855706.1 TRAP transporter small permease [Mesorhizobium sp. J428]
MKSFFMWIDAMLRRLSLLGFIVASALLLIVGIMGAADVVSTNIFMKPIPGMVELSGAILGVIVFLGLAEAQARGANIMIDVSTQKMSPRMLRISTIFSLGLGVIFMVMMAWLTTRLAISAWTYREVALGALAFPMTPFKAVAAFGAWLAAAEFIRQFVRTIFVGVEIREVKSDV